MYTHDIHILCREIERESSKWTNKTGLNMILRVLFTNSMVTRRQAFWGARQSLCFGPIYTWHPSTIGSTKWILNDPKGKESSSAPNCPQDGSFCAKSTKTSKLGVDSLNLHPHEFLLSESILICPSELQNSWEVC